MSEQKLRLTLHATALKNVAGAFKGTSDPYAEVKLVASGSDQGILLGRTESIKNSLSPKWTTSFLFDYSSATEKEACIKVLVADKIRKKDDKFIGSAEFKIKDILLSQGSIQDKQLTDTVGKQDGIGTLFAHIREVPPISANKMLTLRWQGYRGKSDLFFVVLRDYDDGDDGDRDDEDEDGKAFSPVYVSERIQSNLSPNGSPQWNVANIDVHALCDGDLNRSFYLVVFDYDMSPEADHVHLCHFKTTVNELIEKNKGKPYKLTKGSEPCGTISLDECEMTEAEADTLSMTNPVDKLQLTLHASGLKNVAGVGKGISDPYAEVKLIASGSSEDQGQLLGRTEVIKNSLSPEWTTSFIFDHSFGKEACIKVSVVDKVRKGSGIPMGSAVFKIEDILGKQGQGGSESKQLANKEDEKQDGTFSARIQKVPPKSAGKLIMRWQEFRGKSDPFFEVRRTYDEGKTWAPVYRSDRVKSNWSPQWNPATIDINTLCDGDLNSKILLAVLDFDKKGKHVHLGTFETTVNELIKSGEGKSFKLKKGSEAVGTISLDECGILKPPPSTSEEKPNPTKPPSPTPRPTPTPPPKTMAAMDTHKKSQLTNFITRHTAHHTPIALVTSGGTSAPLERNCVRFLDNFSTGTRGAHAVEQFLSKGYAVIHLKRTGSVSPFGRLLNNALGCGKEGLTIDTFGKLFDVGLNGDGGLSLDDGDDDSMNNKKEDEGNDDSNDCPDPWLYSKCDQKSSTETVSSTRRRRGELSLNHRLVNSTTLQATIRTYKHIHQQGLLLTINFETVDDYLQKLQLCSEAISIAGPLGLVYLAAAVSDFYIPKEKQALHKIQSRDYGIKSQASSSNVYSTSEEESNSGDDNMQVKSDNTLTLTLYPVPKVVPTLRKEWCPNAFVVGFKLETDATILRRKSVIAMEKNYVHLVIGNELATRYEKVFILSRGGSDVDLEDDGIAARSDGCKQYGASELPAGFHVSEVTAAHGVALSSAGMNGNGNKTDALEYATIECVVRHHFHYISTDENSCAINPNAASNQKLSPAQLIVETTMKAKKNHDERLEAQYRQLQRERLKARAVDFAWNAAGSVIGMAISYGIGRMLSGRQQQYGA